MINEIRKYIELSRGLLKEISIKQKYDLETRNGKNHLPWETYEQLCNIDPTKKGENAGKLTNWILQKYTPDTDWQQLRIALEQFVDGCKSHILQRYNLSQDINTYNSYEALIQSIQSIMQKDDANVSESEYNNRQKLEGQFVVLGSSANYEIIVPYTWEAERYFGRGTNWCTVANEDYFESYTNGSMSDYMLNDLDFDYDSDEEMEMDADEREAEMEEFCEYLDDYLYIIYPKDNDNKKKLQFHFGNRSFATADDTVKENPYQCINISPNAQNIKELKELCQSCLPIMRLNRIFPNVLSIFELLDDFQKGKINTNEIDRFFYYTNNIYQGRPISEIFYQPENTIIILKSYSADGSCLVKIGNQHIEVIDTHNPTMLVHKENYTVVMFGKDYGYILDKEGNISLKIGHCKKIFNNDTQAIIQNETKTGYNLFDFTTGKLVFDTWVKNIDRNYESNEQYIIQEPGNSNIITQGVKQFPDNVCQLIILTNNFILIKTNDNKAYMAPIENNRHIIQIPMFSSFTTYVDKKQMAVALHYPTYSQVYINYYKNNIIPKFKHPPTHVVSQFDAKIGTSKYDIPTINRKARQYTTSNFIYYGDEILIDLGNKIITMNDEDVTNQILTPEYLSLYR